MAISILNGYKVGSANPIDTRFVMTKEDMKAAKDSMMPEVYPTRCSEDGKQYIYRKTNEVDEVTGKFRVVEGAEGDVVVEEDVKADFTVGAVEKGDVIPEGTTLTELVKLIFKKKPQPGEMACYYGIFDGDDMIAPTESDINSLPMHFSSERYYESDPIDVDYGKPCYAYPKAFGELTSIKLGFMNYINSFNRLEVTVNGEVYYCYIIKSAFGSEGVDLVFA